MSQSKPPSKSKVSDDMNTSSDGSIKRPRFPSSITTKQERTNSTLARAFEKSTKTGTIKVFNRSKGHGFILADDSEDEIFVHVSDIEGEYVPLPGDQVEYRLCPIPPKLDKSQAVHVKITNFCPEVHSKWTS